MHHHHPRHIPPPSPPRVIPPPLLTPGHHSTVITVVFVSLAASKIEILEFNEHAEVQGAIVPSPHAEKITVLNIEEDVHL
uniref:Uncharacterized protein n=1 Tax=Populus trichocarpa TaxID=3694 RepID=B9IHW4_POPTR